MYLISSANELKGNLHVMYFFCWQVSENNSGILTVRKDIKVNYYLKALKYFKPSSAFSVFSVICNKIQKSLMLFVIITVTVIVSLWSLWSVYFFYFFFLISHIALFLKLTLSMLGKTSRRHVLRFKIVYRQSILIFHSSCLLRGHFSWTFNAYFLGKIRKKTSSICRLLNRPREW